MPDLSDSPGPSEKQAQAGDSKVSSSQPIDGRFEMKPLGEDYQKGEKNTTAQTVKMAGQNVEVHEKDWLRQQANAKRQTEGKGDVSDKDWKANVATTQYMNGQQRQEHQMSFRAGQDATGAANMKVGGDSLKKGGEHIFVMDGEGQLFAKEAQQALNQKDATGRGVHVHHSSFLAGEAVAGAGEMMIDQQGFVKEVTDRSGHYKPGEAQTTQTLGELENKGVNLNNVKFTMDRGADKTTGMAKEYQQGGEQTFKARHTMADELKERGQSVREMLDKDADRRATRVRKAGEYLEDGMDYDKVSPAAQAHAAKDAEALDSKFDEALGDQLAEQKEDLAEVKASVRDSLGSSASQGYQAQQLGGGPRRGI